MTESTASLSPTSDSWSMFLYGMKAPTTREKYKGRIAKFFDFVGLAGATMEERSNTFAERAVKDSGWVLLSVMKFVQLQKERVERKEISAATLRNYIKAIKLFCEMNDIAVAWKKITKGLPKARRYANDRAPSLEEIRQVTKYPDRRIKGIVYTMCSSGIRLEAWNYLQRRHLRPVERNGKIVACKVVVYADDPEEYYSFISAEAYEEVSQWIHYREQAGEKITGDSWLMRDLWSTKRGCIEGFITAPRKLKATGVKRLVEDALWTQGVRTRLPAGKKRHEFQANHGFRKWFKTRCELAGMKPINIEILMGHSVGISDSYYRPTEHELLDDYLKAVDHLTISGESKLYQEIDKLKREHEEDSLQQDAIGLLSDQLIKLSAEVQELKKASHRPKTSTSTDSVLRSA